MADPRQPEREVAVESETNAQNSELDPQARPSGARIERMKNEVEHSKGEIADDGKAKYISSDDLTVGMNEETAPKAPLRQSPAPR